MKTILCIGAVLLATLIPATAWAANARNPYGNVNRANDAGNDTGDSQVEALNQAQLNAARGYAPPPVVFVPPPPYPYVYAAPPPYYPPPVYVVPRRRYYYGW